MHLSPATIEKDIDRKGAAVGLMNRLSHHQNTTAADFKNGWERWRVDVRLKASRQKTAIIVKQVQILMCEY